MEVLGIHITHPEKILFPKEEITKGDLIKYYHWISEKMVPLIKDRPLTLQRFPSGIKKDGFYQKNVSDYFPSFIKRVEVQTEEGTSIQCICNNKKSLIYLVNQNTISFHSWLSKKDRLDQPDKVIFDLDPLDHSFEEVKQAAFKLRAFLIDRHRRPHLMTTGQNGLHVYYKIRRSKSFDEVKKEVKQLAEDFAASQPKTLTTKLRKDQREGKIFIDYLRNAYGQTAVCPYSIRPTETAGIAMPIEWELLDAVKSSDEFTFKNVYRNTLPK